MSYTYYNGLHTISIISVILPINSPKINPVRVKNLAHTLGTRNQPIGSSEPKFNFSSLISHFSVALKIFISLVFEQTIVVDAALLRREAGELWRRELAVWVLSNGLLRRFPKHVWHVRSLSVTVAIKLYPSCFYARVFTYFKNSGPSPSSSSYAGFRLLYTRL